MPRLAALFAGLVALTVSAVTEAADSYPSKPLRMVITFPAGGPSDVVVRLVTQRMTEEWGHPVIIDNRGGAGGIVGTEVVAHAPPDGYTFLVGTAGGMTINPALHAKLSYDPFRDFAPVGMLVMNPQILIAHPSVPAKTVRELVQYAKERPGQLNFGSAGSGTATHLGLELLKLSTGMQAVHVPYKGGAPALTDLVGGQIQLLWLSIPSVLPHVKSGRLRALAVSTLKRSASALEVPTVAESGYPGFDYANWNALFVPAATPQARIAKINARVVKALNEPEIAQKLVAQGADPAPGTPAELGRYMHTDHERWKKVILEAKITAE